MKYLALAAAFTLTQAMLTPVFADDYACDSEGRERRVQAPSRERAREPAGPSATQTVEKPQTRVVQETPANEADCDCRQAASPQQRENLAVRAPDSMLMRTRGVL